MASSSLTPEQWLEQNSQTLNSLDPSDEDYFDLAKFGEAVGDARIVGLAEQSHGGAEEFELKTRLVKYLHEVKGFDVLILESGFYDVGRISEQAKLGEKVDDEGPGNIFFMYSKSLEGRKLLQYIDDTQLSAKPLEFAGMDSQHTGLYSQNELINKLQEFLTSRASAIPGNSDWSAFANVSNHMFRRFDEPYTIPSEPEQTAFANVIGLLKNELCVTQTDNFETSTSPGWWCQIAKDLESTGTLYWSNPVDDQRDHTIGSNVIWLAENPFAGKKIIVWGHAVHVLYNYPFDSTHNNAGTVIRNHFGTEYYVANVTAYEGSFRNYGDLNAYPIQAVQEGSLEDMINKSGKTKTYLLNPNDHTGLEWLDALNARMSNFYYVPSINSNGLGHNYDSYFYFKTVSPVTMNR